MNQFDVTDVNQAVRDSAYAAIGFGVLGFQRAQVRRRELIEAVPAQVSAIADRLGSQVSQLSTAGGPVGEAREQLIELVRLVDERVQPARREFDARVDEIEARLPEGPRRAVQSIRQVAYSREAALREVVGI